MSEPHQGEKFSGLLVAKVKGFPWWPARVRIPRPARFRTCSRVPVRSLTLILILILVLTLDGTRSKRTPRSEA